MEENKKDHLERLWEIDTLLKEYTLRENKVFLRLKSLSKSSCVPIINHSWSVKVCGRRPRLHISKDPSLSCTSTMTDTFHLAHPTPYIPHPVTQGKRIHLKRLWVEW